MLYFTESDVRRLLPMDQAIARMRQVFADLRSGRAQNQPRRRLVLETGAVLHQMAGSFGAYFGTKIYSTHPRGGAHFLFVLYRAEDGAPLALFEANHLGQIRTGAASGYATDLLALPDAETVGMIGTGFQAETQLEAVLVVRPARSVRVWSRNEERRRAFAARCSERFGVEVQAAPSAEAAVRGARILVTATNAREPVLSADWVSPGAHVNAIGSNRPKRRELPDELLRRAAVIAADSIEQARAESGDLIQGLDDAGWHGVVELQDVAGRPSADAITLFKSNGLAVEDVAAAAYVFESAEKSGIARLPAAYS